MDEYNKAIVEMCDANGWKFLNSAEALKDAATGYAKDGYVESSDGIHLTRAAMDALFTYIRTHSYITEDTRPALTTIPEHTGDKDAVTYTTPAVEEAPAAPEEPVSTESAESAESEPTPTPAATETPAATPEPAATPAPDPTPAPTPESTSEAVSSESASSEAAAEPTPAPETEQPAADTPQE